MLHFKKMNPIRLLSFLGLFLFGFSAPVLSVHAEEPAVPEAMVIGDNDGIHVQSDGKYLVNLEGILPGDEFDKTITFTNNSDEPYILTFWQEAPVQVSGPIDFGKALTMELALGKGFKTPFEGLEGSTEGHTIFYKGLLDAPELQEKQAVNLGEIKKGETYEMNVHFTMDSSYTEEDYREKSATENVWHFEAIRNEPAQPGEKEKNHGFLSQFGDNGPLLGWLIAGVLILLIAVGVYVKMCRDHNEKSEVM